LKYFSGKSLVKTRGHLGRLRMLSSLATVIVAENKTQDGAINMAFPSVQRTTFGLLPGGTRNQR
jgi:hypothetical protein